MKKGMVKDRASQTMFFFKDGATNDYGFYDCLIYIRPYEQLLVGFQDFSIIKSLIIRSLGHCI